MKYEALPVEGFSDARAKRYFDIFSELNGQVTVSAVKPNQFSGWHKHKLQYDKFFVARGAIKVGIISPNGEIIEKELNDNSYEVLQIPPEHWHCWVSKREGAVLIYYLSRKHDENDEIRGSVEDIFDQFSYRIEV